MYRRWRVRHSYPQPVVDLVAALMPRHGVPEIARLLDIPASVIYRWRTRRRIAPGRGAPADARTIAALVADCDALGLRFGERLHAAGCASSEIEPVAAAPALDVGTPDRPAASAVVHDAAIVPRERAAAGNAAPGGRAASAPHALAAARYAFDVRRERPERGVRRRLEAVRRLIESQYFLDIDSRMLAAAARMSRHHFIRMFSGVYGISPHQYLTRARIGAAKRLLLFSREPIEVIAVGVGFRSGPSFNRAFKQIEGASASQYSRAVVRERPAPAPARHGGGRGPAPVSIVDGVED